MSITGSHFTYSFDGLEIGGLAGLSGPHANLDARGQSDFALGGSNVSLAMAASAAPWSMAAAYLKLPASGPQHVQSLCACPGCASISPSPIDGPQTQTVVMDYTAILETSWYNISTAGPPETDHAIILTFSFETSAQDYLAERGFSGAFAGSFVSLGEGEKGMARGALAQWADASGIIFIEVPAGLGDLQFGKYDFDLDPPSAGFAGFAYYGALDDSDGRDYTGDVFLDSETAPSILIYLHEIGHALGYKHPFEGEPTLDEDFDNHDFTVMSYTDPPGPPVEDLGPFDIDAVHHVYGVAGDDGSHVSSWSYNSVKLVLTQTGFAGADLIRGSHGKDKINGGDGDDELWANEGKDTVKGGDGADTINAGDANDTVDGGSGDDTISAGLGNDTVDGGSGNDTIDDFGGFNEIDSGSGSEDELTYWRDDIASDQIFTLTAVTDGFAMDDGSIILNTETFVLVTGDGDDTVTFDNLGNGEYNWFGGDGDNEAVIDFSASNKFVVADGGFAGTSYDGSEFRKSVFAGDARVHVIGGKVGDFLGGTDDDDTLEGGKGSDELTGGAGRDTLKGGTGGDLLIYEAVSESTGPGRDTVIGFDALEDSFQVIEAVTGVDATVTAGTLREGSFNSDLAAAIGGAQLAANHAVVFDPSGGNLKDELFLIIDQDGTSGYDANFDLVIQITGAANLGSLDSGDFTT